MHMIEGRLTRPFGARRRPVKRSGRFMGQQTTSCTVCFASASPAISSKVTGSPESMISFSIFSTSSLPNIRSSSGKSSSSESPSFDDCRAETPPPFAEPLLFPRLRESPPPWFLRVVCSHQKVQNNGIRIFNNANKTPTKHFCTQYRARTSLADPRLGSTNLRLSDSRIRGCSGAGFSEPARAYGLLYPPPPPPTGACGRYGCCCGGGGTCCG